MLCCPSYLELTVWGTGAEGRLSWGFGESRGNKGGWTHSSCSVRNQDPTRCTPECGTRMGSQLTLFGYSAVHQQNFHSVNSRKQESLLAETCSNTLENKIGVFFCSQWELSVCSCFGEVKPWERFPVSVHVAKHRTGAAGAALERCSHNIWEKEDPSWVAFCV